MSNLKDQLTALTIAKIYFQRHLEAPEAAEYIAQRHISPQSIRRFELGYSPDAWRGLVDHFSSHKVRLAAKEAGLLTTPGNSNRLLDFFRGRLMFPIKSAEGTLVGYGARLVGDKDGPKYINTPETELFNKSASLYGFHENKAAIQETRSAILVEGYMDVIRLSEHGFNVGVAPMGTALTEGQVALILDSGVNRLWICLDGDAAGQKAATRSIQTIMEHYHPRMQIMIATLPEQMDPDTFLHERGANAFRAAMRSATPLPTFIHNLCAANCGTPPSIEDKAAYALMLKPYVEMAAGTLQDELLTQCNAYTGLEQSDVLGSSASGRIASDQVSEWNQHVTTAARLLLHADTGMQVSFADQIQQLNIQGHGYPELRQLAIDTQTDTAPGGLLAHFAYTMGPPTHSEIAVFAASWKEWLSRESLTESLEAFSAMPFDADARNQVKEHVSMRM